VVSFPGGWSGWRGGRIPLALLLIGAFTVIWLLGSSNPVTPAGYVGYLTQGAVIGKSRFYGLQKGPTSPGRTWLLSTTNISITPYTYSEEFTGNNTGKPTHAFVCRIIPKWCPNLRAYPRARRRCRL